MTGNGGIAALAADGVGFAVHFLHQEVQLASHRLGAFHDPAKLGKVAAQPHGFFIDRQTVGDDRRFGKNTGLIGDGAVQKLGELSGEAGAVFDNGLRGALLHKGEVFLHGDDTGKDIGTQPLALGFPHCHKAVESILQHLQYIGGKLLLVLLVPAQGKDVRQTGNGGEGEIIGKGIFLAQSAQGGEILTGKGVIHRNRGVAAFDSLQGEGDLHLAAGNSALQGALQAILQKGAAARCPAGKLEIAMVDGTDLDGDAAPVQELLIPSVAGHAAYHGKNIPFHWSGGESILPLFFYLNILSHLGRAVNEKETTVCGFAKGGAGLPGRAAQRTERDGKKPRRKGSFGALGRNLHQDLLLAIACSMS